MTTTTFKSNPNGEGHVKNLNQNMSKEEALEIVERYGPEKWEEFKTYDFPYPEIKKESVKKYWDKLLNSPGKKDPKLKSPITGAMHPSMYTARSGSHLSPFEAWEFLKKDYKAWKDFFYNRITRSDWFKVNNRMDEWARKGRVPLNIWFCGLSTSGKYKRVGYFKDYLAKYIVEKYCAEFDTIVDPTCGFAGRMLGTLASKKNYIGRDLNAETVRELNNIYHVLIEDTVSNTIDIQVEDLFKAEEKTFDDNVCLFTCTPYGSKTGNNLESWNFDEKGNSIDVNMDCDSWIDAVLQKYHCKKYVFVTDDKIEKYKDKVVEEIENVGYWGQKDGKGKNKEYIVVIEK